MGKTLTEAGRRVVAFDNRGHGRSEKFHDPAAVLIAAGTKDDLAGNPHELAAMFRRARAVDIPGRDHNRAVGDTVYKESVLEFLEQRP